MSMLLNEFEKMKIPCFQFSLSSEMECLKNSRHETVNHREKSRSFYEKALIQVEIFHDHFSGRLHLTPHLIKSLKSTRTSVKISDAMEISDLVKQRDRQRSQSTRESPGRRRKTSRRRFGSENHREFIQDRKTCRCGAELWL